MKIFSLYMDFFKFLEKITSQSKQWDIYSDNYYQPHKSFLEKCFSHFPFIDSQNLKQRVEAIKTSDYSGLKNLISAYPPEKIIEEAYVKCKEAVSPKGEPAVYLFIGFFSPEGFVMNFRGKPVICFGLERFKDFRLLRILFAHEYAHFLLNLIRGEVIKEKKLKWLLISEGIATYLSYLVFPDHKLFDHLLFSRDRLNWCHANEEYLREIYCSGRFSSLELRDFFDKGNPELDIPPRVGKYLGFQAVKKYLAQNKEKNLGLLLSDNKLALSLEL